MEKTIKLDSNTSIKVSNNIGWMIAYRDQFGQDIVPAITPVMSALLELSVDILEAREKGASAEDIFRALDPDAVRSALFSISGLEFVDFIHIVWAMAKAADDDIPEPAEWAKGLTSFPVDTIAPIIFELAYKCLLSSKNSKRLQTAMQTLKSLSTES